jgi:hypothetical protein
MKLGTHIKKNEPSLHLFIHLVNNNRMETPWMKKNHHHPSIIGHLKRTTKSKT